MVTKFGKIVPIQHICIFGDDSDKTILEWADYYVYSSSAILILTTALSLNQNSYMKNLSLTVEMLLSVFHFQIWHFLERVTQTCGRVL